MDDFDSDYFQFKIVNYLYESTGTGKTRMIYNQIRIRKKEVGRVLNSQFNKVEVVDLMNI
jgi:hypothetical protein